MTEKKRMIMNVDVKEDISWGIDIYTAFNVINVLPTNFDLLDKYNFVEEKLSYSV
jgi:hypothetical protein